MTLKKAEQSELVPVATVSIVTGAARGIGNVIAQKLADKNTFVIAVDRGFEHKASFAQKNVLLIQADVSKPKGVDTVIATLNSLEPCRLVTLVNNAGVGNAKSAEQTSFEEWQESISSNLNNTFLMSRAAIPHLSREGGSIVNISSIFGIMGVRGSAPYSAAKAAIIGLTKQMAAELGPRQIRVNAIAPGLIETPATSNRLTENQDFRRLLVGRTPLGCFGQPEDIANGVKFLASPEARFINGHTLVIDGGWSATHFQE